MRVIYVKTLFERIADEITRADEENREIEEIVLTASEWAQLGSEMAVAGYVPSGWVAGSTFNYSGVRLAKDIHGD